MDIVVLQWLDEDTLENKGGLYVSRQHITAIRCEKHYRDNTYYPRVYVNGADFLVCNPIEELLVEWTIHPKRTP